MTTVLTLTPESNPVRCGQPENSCCTIRLVVILSGAKDLGYWFCTRKSHGQRCFASLNMTSCPDYGVW